MGSDPGRLKETRRVLVTGFYLFWHWPALGHYLVNFSFLNYRHNRGNNQNVIINVIIIIIIILIVMNTQKIAHCDLLDQTSFNNYQECMKAFKNIYIPVYYIYTKGIFLQNNQLPHASLDASAERSN